MLHVHRMVTALLLMTMTTVRLLMRLLRCCFDRRPCSPVAARRGNRPWPLSDDPLEQRRSPADVQGRSRHEPGRPHRRVAPICPDFVSSSETLFSVSILPRTQLLQTVDNVSVSIPAQQFYIFFLAGSAE